MKTIHTSDSKVAEGRLVIKGASVFASITEGGWVDDKAVSKTIMFYLISLTLLDLSLAFEPLALEIKVYINILPSWYITVYTSSIQTRVGIEKTHPK